MNIELEEVVQDVSDEALEMAAGGARGGVYGAENLITLTAQACGCQE
jgi:hypothetical protein